MVLFRESAINIWSPAGKGAEQNQGTVDTVKKILFSTSMKKQVKNRIFILEYVLPSNRNFGILIMLVDFTHSTRNPGGTVLWNPAVSLLFQHLHE